jgi:citrate lyase subunit beta/citryl-CoA lyase
VQRRPFRSLLYIPADKPEWMAKAPKYGADAYILDLEDAVIEDNKAAARQHAREAIPALAAEGVGVFVRINAVGTPYWLDDLRTVVVPGLTGIGLPKASSAGQVAAVSLVLDVVERQEGVEPGEVDLHLLLETAAGIENAAALLRASPRVRSYFGGVARDGDINRELGLRWTRDGRESLYLRSKLLLAGRAAGIAYPVTGTWTDVADLDGLRAYAAEGRDLGYSGMQVIHPSHVRIAKEVFTPSPAEVDRLRRMLAEFERAEEAGHGVVRFEGSMIDIAMAGRARELLAGLMSGGDEPTS